MSPDRRRDLLSLAVLALFAAAFALASWVFPGGAISP